MLNYLYFMEFLYFPEDKADYIPGLIALAVFMCGAVVATIFIIKKSKKDEEKFEQKYLNIDQHPNETKE